MEVRVWGCRGSHPRPLTQDELDKKYVALLEKLVTSGKLDGLRTENVTQDGLRKILDSLHSDELRTYGGNSSCYMVTTPGCDRVIFLDSGTGMTEAGKFLIGRKFATGGKPILMDVLLSHGHNDHTEGFVFCGPTYMKDTEANVYGLGHVSDQIQTAVVAHDESQKSGTRTIRRKRLLEAAKSLDTAVQIVKQEAGIIAPKQDSHVENGEGRTLATLSGYRAEGRHPVSLPMQAGMSNMGISDILPGSTMQLNGVEVYCASGNHPQGALLYRLTERATGRTLVFTGDWEHGLRLDDLDPITHQPKVASPRDFNREMIEFMTGAHVVLTDSQYVGDHYNGKGKFPVSTRGWGHPIDTVVLDVVAEAAEKSGHPITAILTHHEPNYVDSFMNERARMLQQYLESTGKDKLVSFMFAREGMIIKV